MAITSSTFGRTILTGKDAEQMLKQIKNSKPNANAKRSLENARQNRQKTVKNA
ncbi:hypothetical protein I4632_17055 [Proteus mirabilis]|uniref:hypothetical protein n=1 Tax=Proteus TaxID=583 RepID=UPI0018C578BD|nr:MULTISPECIES: hypothetical protein [Proteus]MBG3081914.1 hypothetical protein [Proteus mirabilis]MBI6338046.1 hypothetical protein [Proteus sp. PR00224]MBI6404476.1 hypothetical protein [Proteus sp. PR00208]MBI6544047.1 hypothetical protein [Proteus vulgaris]MDY3696554.1 hypothetical protein [Proteus mirabilis]